MRLRLSESDMLYWLEEVLSLKVLSSVSYMDGCLIPDMFNGSVATLLVFLLYQTRDSDKHRANITMGR